MTRTTIVAVARDGAHPGCSFPQSSTCGFVWRTLQRTYLGSDGRSNPEDAQLQLLLTDSRLTPDEQIALATTFDGVTIHRQETLWVASALDAFAARYERRKHGRGTTTLPLQAAYLRSVATHPEVLALGWQHGDRTAPSWFLFVRYPHLVPHTASIRSDCVTP